MVALCMDRLGKCVIIHREGLRLVLGACRTSPKESLYTEAHEAPLEQGTHRILEIEFPEFSVKFPCCNIFFPA